MIDQALLARAREAASVVGPLAERIERERRLPEEAVAALVRARVFKMFVPRAYGGEDAHPSTALASIEAIARGDGSSGWCAMIGVTSSLMSRYLDAPTAREVYGPDDAITCGVFAPTGRATPTDDGKAYRVTGRWSFASGCEHSRFRMGGVIAADDPSTITNVLFSADETKVIDTWDVSGLRGSGSHDIEATDVVVPRTRMFSLMRDVPSGGAYALPVFGTLAAGVAAVGLGIARAALDAFTDLAKTKRPPGAKRTLAQRESVQLDVGRAEARLEAARAHLFVCMDAATGDGEGLVLRAKLRLAACHAAEEGAAIATLAYRAGGGAAVYARHPLQRHLRDAQVVTQHLMVSSTAATTAGAVLLGVETDSAAL